MNTERRLTTGPIVENVSQQDLYGVILGACSHDPRQVKASSERLKEMLDMFGTYDGLHEIAAQRSSPLAARQQAIIQLKNVIHNHWRSRKVLSDEHRMRIRQRCMMFLEEGDDTIAECSQVIVAKIARNDYPKNWPNLVNDVMNLIDNNLSRRYSSVDDNPHETLLLRRSLGVLNATVKEFANMKMPNGVKVMANITEQLKVTLYGYYSKIASVLSSLSVENIASPRMHDDILLAHMVYKCLTKMAIWLWTRIDKLSFEEHQRNQSWIEDFFRSSAIQLQSFATRRRDICMALSHSPSDYPVKSVDILTRHVLLFGKFFRRMQQREHPRFVALPMCSELVLFYWSQVVEATAGTPERISDTTTAIYSLRFLVQGIVLFKENMTQWTPVRRDGTPNKNSLSREFVENAVQLLVTRFIPLNAKDLDDWMADPEEWVNAEEKENEYWEFEIRACSERVLVQLANHFTEFVVPLLHSTFKEMAPQRVTDFAGIIQKEALYCAIGRCATRLKTEIPFDEWLQHTLRAEAQDNNPNYPILKRRIAWLAGKLVAEGCASPNKPLIWELLVNLLRDRGPGTDVVVRLTAAVAIRQCVDSVAFQPIVLEPFLSVILENLVCLIAEAEVMETKRRVNSCLNTFIEQVGSSITPFLSTVTEPFPQLCTRICVQGEIELRASLGSSAGDDWLFKSSLLVTVNKLVESAKEQASLLYVIVVPLVRESLAQGAATHLDEDGVNLWLAALRNAITLSNVTGSPGLAELLPHAISMLATHLDLLGKLANIIESYLLLDATSIMQAFGSEVFRAILAALKSQAVMSNLSNLVLSLSLLVQLAPSSTWGEALHTSGLFSHLITTLIDGEANTLFLTDHVHFFARVVLADRQIFQQLMTASAASLGVSETYLYDGLLDQWWAKFDNMSEPKYRKLAAMGIACLISTGRPEVLKRLPGEIFNLWLDVFGEIKEGQAVHDVEEASLGSSISPAPFKRHWEQEEAPAQFFQGSQGTLEYERRKAIYDQDPVRTSQLSHFIGTHVREAESICGAEMLQSYLSSADPAVLNQIQNELIRT